MSNHMAMHNFIWRQLFTRLPYPTADHSGQTVIVTGSNVGLGKEAARHFTRLGAAKVIIAVRTVEKGEEAKKDIESTTNCKPGTVEVWQLDLSKYDSVKEFASRADRELSRVDILLENAGIAPAEWRLMEENESTITTNVVSTFLLAYLMLPKLKDTATKYNVRPNLTIVSSDVQFWSKFEQRKAAQGEIFNTLSDKTKFDGDFEERYYVSKLLEVFVVREMANQRPAESYPVTMNYVNPGLCHSELARESGLGLYIMKLLLARSTEVGSRTLYHAAASGIETHGKFMSDCQITDPAPMSWNEEGRQIGKRVYDELMAKLDKISPGVSANL